MKQENNLFPVFLKMNQLNTLIVGGGHVAYEKIRALLKNDPKSKITVVSPFIKQEILDMAIVSPFIKTTLREVIPTDLIGINIALLATNNSALNFEIKRWAMEKNVMVNVADTPELCDFYLGSTVRKGDLKIGISTNGQSPTFAKRFRELLEHSIPDETNELLQNLKSIREKLKGDFTYKVKKLNEITKGLGD